MENIKLIFFDVETNGLQGSSVLSISAMKLEYIVEKKMLLRQESIIDSILEDKVKQFLKKQ